MNHIYRTVRNEITGAVTVASEHAKRGGKKASDSGNAVATSGFILSSFASIAALSFTSASYASPEGGVVVAGDAIITGAQGNTTILQNSQNAALNWQSFDIGAGETVHFAQPNSSAVALNRVLGVDPSRILGNLSANGKVFLINPNGVLFGTSAQVTVGGLVASTRSISDSDFMAGRYQFSGSTDGSVVNEGSITADGGYVALLGANVSNQGVIAARLGTVALAAGDALTLDVAGDGLLNVTVDAGAVHALAHNGGLIQADGGHVLLTAHSASNLVQSAVNNTGLIQARTIENHNGVIRLMGDMQSGTVTAGGTLDASAPNGGNGGFVETSAAHVQIASDAVITTQAPQGLTGHWLIDPFDFTIAATGGDITGAALSTLLNSNSVTIQTTTGTDTATNLFGTTGTNGDVNVNDTVSWTANQLTLNAQNDININTAMNGSGTASLALQYGQGAVAAGNTSTVNVRAPINLPSGNNLGMTQGSDGVVKNYAVINSMAALQAINSNLTGNYALGSNLSASSAFTPIGTLASQFTGSFDGLGHTISNLSVSQNAHNGGLFGVNGAAGVITNVRMSNTSINISSQSNAGSLAGYNFGTISNVYSTSVNISSGRNAGGLVGTNEGSISTSATGTGNTTALFFSGGLVGYQVNANSSIRNSYAGVNSSWYLGVGGLVGGMDAGLIENSYATGIATGPADMGQNPAGLVGYRGGGTITNSYYNASGNARGVGAGDTTGATGLTTAGLRLQANFGPQGSGTGEWDFANTWVMYESQTAPLLRAFMTPLTVTAAIRTVTYNGHVQTASAATYSVAPNMGNLLGTLSYTGGGSNVGSHATSASGLYSNQLGYVINYAAGTVTIDPYAVSLTGSRAYNGSNIVSASSLVTGTLANGETLNLSGSGTVASKDAGLGKTVALGTLALANGTGLASNYTLTGGTRTVDITRVALTATAIAPDKVYDGNTNAGVTLDGLTGLVGSETVTATGTASFNSKDVATANLVTVNSIALGDGSNGGLASNYTLASGQTASAHITAQMLTAIATTADKVYDGTTTAAATLSGLTGLIGTETLNATGTASFNSKDVATANLVTVNSVALSDGSNGGLASNYTLASGQTASAHITAQTLTAIATAADKIYDGTTTATATLSGLTGLIGTETLNATGTASFNSKDVATANLVTVNSVTLSDGANGSLASNYILGGGQTASAHITARALTAAVTAPDKIYDGTTTASATLGALTGLIGNETLNVSNTASFNSKDVATANLVTVNSIALSNGGSGGLASNYTLAAGQTTGASITPKTLVVVDQVAGDKEYDGTTAATLTGGSLAGVIAGETLALIQSGSFVTPDAGTAIAVTAANSLSGAAAVNYTLTQPTGLTANITAPPVVVTPPVSVISTEEYRAAVGHVSVNAQTANTAQTAPTTATSGASSPGTSAAPGSTTVSTSNSVGLLVSTNLTGLNLVIVDDGVQLPVESRLDNEAQAQ